jgi:thiol-disulfide isomerase/thioredoxin
MRDNFVTSSISRRSLLAAGGAALAVALAACTAQDSLSKQVTAGDNKNYIAGDGSVTEYGISSRTAPVAFTGKLFDGTTVNADSFRGKVTVLNFWYAACAPCRKEAPDLQALHAEFEPQGVLFYGVNIRDERATADAFDRTFGLTYPSFQDQDGGVLLAMTNFVPASAVPTTVVLDEKGRVSARILGELDKGTLKTLIQSALAEK